MDKQAVEQAKWYALYTQSRAEKKLYTQLTRKGIECFLPLKKTLRQYSDRKKWVEVPLINSYLFIRVAGLEYYDALNTPGAVRFICFEGRAVPIPDSQVEALQNLVLNRPQNIDIEMGRLSAGDRMEMTRGPLKGIKGELIQLRGHHRLLLRFDSLGFCVHTEVGLEDVKRVDKQLVA